MEEKKEKNGELSPYKGLASVLGERTREKDAGLAYSALALVLVVVPFALSVVLLAAGLTKKGYNRTDWYLYLSYLLTPCVFAVVCFLYFRKTKTPFMKTVAPCKPKYFLLAIVVQIGLLSLSELNALFITLLSKFGYEQPEILLPSLEGFGLVSVLFVVAVLPAVFEELLFRGVLLNGVKGCGKVGACLICGGLFALYHQSPVQTVYPFVCGAVFAWVALTSGSVLPTVVSHFLNNAAIIILTKAGYAEIPSPAKWVVLSVSLVCLICGIVWLFLENKNAEREERTEKKSFLIGAVFGILIFGASWLLSLLSGFTA